MNPLTDSKKLFKIASLEEVLSYKFDNLVYKFMENFDVTFEEAEELFIETKKWLWLCGQPEKKISMSIQNDMAMLDEMWHAFILFTREYTMFCEKYLGRYIHHAPTTKIQKEEFKLQRDNDPNKYLEKYEQELRIQMEHVYDTLGEEAVLKWYEIFPQKYTHEKIKELRKNN